jgi:hypothetical protein
MDQTNKVTLLISFLIVTTMLASHHVEFEEKTIPIFLNTAGPIHHDHGPDREPAGPEYGRQIEALATAAGDDGMAGW